MSLIDEQVLSAWYYGISAKIRTEQRRLCYFLCLGPVDVMRRYKRILLLRVTISAMTASFYFFGTTVLDNKKRAVIQSLLRY
jgi:hypothetical protein